MLGVKRKAGDGVDNGRASRHKGVDKMSQILDQSNSTGAETQIEEVFGRLRELLDKARDDCLKDVDGGQCLLAKEEDSLDNMYTELSTAINAAANTIKFEVSGKGNKCWPVPEWLQDSDLFKKTSAVGLALRWDLFSDRFIRSHSDIACIADFNHVMLCIDYWGVEEWPTSVFTFTALHLLEVKDWRDETGSPIGKHVNFCDYILAAVREEDDPMPWTEKVSSAAAGVGSIGWLKYAHGKRANGCPLNWDTCSNAAGGGHFSCLKYAHENGCLMDAWTCSKAASGGYFSCLKYAKENGCPWNEGTCASAASGGHLSCLTYAHDRGCPWNAGTCANAASGGYLSCLQYAHANGCRWNRLTCSNAAREGHLSCLKYAHENGCPWDVSTPINAAEGGDVSCLQYAKDNGCPWDDWRTYRADWRQQSTLEWALRNLVANKEKEERRVVNKKIWANGKW